MARAHETARGAGTPGASATGRNGRGGPGVRENMPREECRARQGIFSGTPGWHGAPRALRHHETCGGGPLGGRRPGDACRSRPLSQGSDTDRSCQRNLERALPPGMPVPDATPSRRPLTQAVPVTGAVPTERRDPTAGHADSSGKPHRSPAPFRSTPPGSQAWRLRRPGIGQACRA